MMNKLILLAASAAFLLGMGISQHDRSGQPVMTSEREAKWVKSRTGAWAAHKDGISYWYKLDKNARLWWSPNGRDWSEVPEGMWADKQNKWLKIGEGKLWWTNDDGKNFEEVPEWKWQGPRGEWYKFDAKWTLWVTR